METPTKPNPITPLATMGNTLAQPITTGQADISKTLEPVNKYLQYITRYNRQRTPESFSNARKTNFTAGQFSKPVPENVIYYTTDAAGNKIFITEPNAIAYAQAHNYPYVEGGQTTSEDYKTGESMTPLPTVETAQTQPQPGAYDTFMNIANPYRQDNLEATLPYIYPPLATPEGVLPPFETPAETAPIDYGGGGYGGGGGGGYSDYTYPNTPFAQYQRGYALRGTPAPNVPGFRTLGQAQQNYNNSQNLYKQQWQQMQVSWRI